MLSEAADSPEPAQIIILDPVINRSYSYWHVFVHRLPAGVYYTWCIDGTNELVDPWARAVTDSTWMRSLGAVGAHHSIRAIVTRGSELLPRRPPFSHDLNNAVIYELHVAGFTAHPSSGVQHPGKFRGVMEKIPYLQKLGITHVELLPVIASGNTRQEWFPVVDTFDREISGIVPPENHCAVLTRVWRSQPRPVAIFESRSLHFSQLPRV